jgi:NADP-dependent 3-hydroxy acid dehydrogenase YdfG
VGYYTGRVVVITGASAGIGRAVAVALAQQGARLALSGRNTEALAETRRLCGDEATVMTDSVDVTDRQHVFDYAAKVVAEFGRVDVLIASAGVIHVGGLLSSELPDIHHVMDVDYYGVVHTAQAFLPHLVASGNGHLVTLSSGLGLIGMAMHTAYCAAKFAVRGFSEALRAEMRAKGEPVSVTCVYLGGVRTSIMKTGTYAGDTDGAAVASAFDRYVVRTEPDVAAAAILRGVAKKRGQLMVGRDAWAVSVAARIAGPGIERFVGPLQRRFKPRR